MPDVNAQMLLTRRDLENAQTPSRTEQQDSLFASRQPVLKVFQFLPAAFCG